MTIDIQQIVLEVIAEIERQRGCACPSGEAPAADRMETKSAPTTAAAESSAARTDGDELVVCSRVVSLTEIGDRLGRIRRLVVRPGAIITPAVRDALADRNITVIHGAIDGPAATTAAKIMLIAARTTYDAAALAGALSGEGLAVEIQTSDCLISVADLLAARVRDGATLGVVLTRDAAAALCLANRLPGVRAIGAADPGAAAESARAVGANVLVIDPRGKGIFPLKQTISAFGRSGPWPCPKVLQPRLG
ncbi:MAG: hypothetical protein JW719_01820 [Pirellulales bacterium]|nr:hypothetical protein [Pirellulales bacterium]